MAVLGAVGVNADVSPRMLQTACMHHIPQHLPPVPSFFEALHSGVLRDYLGALRGTVRLLGDAPPEWRAIAEYLGTPSSETTVISGSWTTEEVPCALWSSRDRVDVRERSMRPGCVLCWGNGGGWWTLLYV